MATFSIMKPFSLSIEGNPFITRFKTSVIWVKSSRTCSDNRIEGNPFITRFKTLEYFSIKFSQDTVLKVIHL